MRDASCATFTLNAFGLTQSRTTIQASFHAVIRRSDAHSKRVDGPKKFVLVAGRHPPEYREASGLMNTSHSISAALRLLLWVTGSAGFALSAVAEQNSPLNPGGWQLRTKVTQTRAGQSQASVLDERTAKVCMTPEFLATNPYGDLYMKSVGNLVPGCAAIDYTHEAQTESWKASCPIGPKRSAHMTFRITTTPDSLESRTIMEIFEAEQHIGTMQFSTSGQLLGECSPDMEKLKPWGPTK